MGIDVARNALAYARITGLMAQSFAANLEDRSRPIDGALAQALRGVDLITVTGGLSYIGAVTFSRLLEKMPVRPWVVCFPLRVSDFRQPIQAFARFGLRTEPLNGSSLRQRKFFDPAEQSRVMTHLNHLKLDPTAKEADGYLHATGYLARPSADVMRLPIKQLIKP